MKFPKKGGEGSESFRSRLCVCVPYHAERKLLCLLPVYFEGLEPARSKTFPANLKKVFRYCHNIVREKKTP